MSRNLKNVHINRRDALKGSLVAGVATVTAMAGLSGTSLADVCRVTPVQPEGPFYPVDDQLDKDADLTISRDAGGARRAEGQVIYVAGVVRGSDCEPIAGALVEIWQACKSGRYNHPGDTSGLTLDPNFQYWGQAVTGADGLYVFKTILPGHYPAGGGWIRPPHIHYKVSKVGYHELITQLYFDGNQFNNADRILRAIPANRRNEVVVKLNPPLAGQEPGSLQCRFDVSISAVV